MAQNSSCDLIPSSSSAFWHTEKGHIIVDNKGRCIGTTLIDPKASAQQAAKNATLMAAAPELLECLQALIACLDNGSLVIDPSDIRATQDEFQNAREAIDKALGKKPKPKSQTYAYEA
jgi:hypothetical protein